MDRRHGFLYASAMDNKAEHLKAEKIALFRYGLIAPLVLETQCRGCRSA